MKNKQNRLKQFTNETTFTSSVAAVHCFFSFRLIGDIFQSIIHQTTLLTFCYRISIRYDSVLQKITNLHLKL